MSAEEAQRLRNLLRDTRVAQRISLGDVANRLGTTSSAVSAIERGTRAPTAVEIDRYAELLFHDLGTKLALRGLVDAPTRTDPAPMFALTERALDDHDGYEPPEPDAVLDAALEYLVFERETCPDGEIIAQLTDIVTGLKRLRPVVAENAALRLALEVVATHVEALPPEHAVPFAAILEKTLADPLGPGERLLQEHYGHQQRIERQSAMLTQLERSRERLAVEVAEKQGRLRALGRVLEAAVHLLDDARGGGPLGDVTVEPARVTALNDAVDAYVAALHPTTAAQLTAAIRRRAVPAPTAEEYAWVRVRVNRRDPDGQAANVSLPARLGGPHRGTWVDPAALRPEPEEE